MTQNKLSLSYNNTLLSQQVMIESSLLIRTDWKRWGSLLIGKDGNRYLLGKIGKDGGRNLCVVLQGFTKEFTSLCALVTHHSVMPELLPVPLRLPRAPRAPPPRREHADLDALAAARHAPHHTPHHTSHHPQHPQHPHHFLAQLDV